jgi:hypothetical protein
MTYYSGYLLTGPTYTPRRFLHQDEEKKRLFLVQLKLSIIFVVSPIRHSIELRFRREISSRKLARPIFWGVKRRIIALRELVFQVERGEEACPPVSIIRITISGPLAAFPATFPIVFVSFFLVYI